MRGCVDYFLWHIFDISLNLLMSTLKVVLLNWAFRKRLKLIRYLKSFQKLKTYDTLLFYSFLKRIKRCTLRKTIENRDNVRYALIFGSTINERIRWVFFELHLWIGFNLLISTLKVVLLSWAFKRIKTCRLHKTIVNCKNVRYALIFGSTINERMRWLLSLTHLWHQS